MKFLSILTLSLAGVVLASCGGGSYRNQSYDHDVVYRTPAYGERYYRYDDDDDDVVVDYDYDDDDEDVVYYRYRPAPVYGYGPYYYYRD